MARVLARKRNKGLRFTGIAFVDGHEVPVVTLDDYAEALLAAEKFEVEHKTATGGKSPIKGKDTFGKLVEDYFASHHLEPTTTDAYRSATNNHLLPYFATMQIRHIDGDVVGKFLRKIDGEGHSLRTRIAIRSVLSSILGWAARVGKIDYNPVLATRPYKKAPLKRRRRVIKQREWLPLRKTFTGAITCLMVDTALSTGVRWGELVDLRAANIVTTGGKPHLYVTHCVAHRPPTEAEAEAFRAAGKTVPKRVMYRKEYTKGVEDRRVPLRTTLAQRLAAHIKSHGLPGDALLFDWGALVAEHPDEWDGRAEAERQDAAWAAKWAATLAEAGPCPTGSYIDPRTGKSGGRHGQQATYSRGCRCPHCSYANSKNVRERRREANGGVINKGGKQLDNPAGWVPDWWFREHVWHPKTRDAGLSWLHGHDLRHAFGEWCVESGIPVRTVQEWMGHASVTTTEIYLANVQLVDPKPLDDALSVMDDVLIESIETDLDPDAAAALDALSKLDPDQVRALLALAQKQHGQPVADAR